MPSFSRTLRDNGCLRELVGSAQSPWRRYASVCTLHVARVTIKKRDVGEAVLLRECDFQALPWGANLLTHTALVLAVRGNGARPHVA